jgi:two-component system, OmpR family, alkaline phosphatase synthesis response regulator PhoP
MNSILIIEDETLIRENTAELLSLNNYQTHTAENGRIGLQMAQTHQPDLILCDVMMPELDGYGVLTHLRETPNLQAIPFIFLTAKADRPQQRHGMELGADDYLTKPFTTSELLTAIKTRLKKYAGHHKIITQERQRNQQLKQEIQQTQQKIQTSQKLGTLQAELLKQFILDLRNPVSTINLAIHMLTQAKNNSDRQQYLEILQTECAREIQILNELEDLQNLLTPENAHLLNRFNILNLSRTFKPS